MAVMFESMSGGMKIRELVCSTSGRRGYMAVLVAMAIALGFSYL
jgi:hypothetical protein